MATSAVGRHRRRHSDRHAPGDLAAQLPGAARNARLLLLSWAFFAGACSAGPSDAIVKLESRGETSLAKYLLAVSEQSGVRHAAREPFEKRALLAANSTRPLARFHSASERLYQLTWQRESDGSRLLAEDKEDRKQRAEALSRARVRGLQRLRSRWEHVRRLSALPTRDLEARAASGDQKAKTLLHPRGLAMTRLALRACAGKLEPIWARGSLSLPIRSLSREEQALAQEGIGNFKWSFRGPDGAQGSFGPEWILKGTLDLALGGTLDRPTIWACLRPQSGRGGSFRNLLDQEAMSREPPMERRNALREKKPKPPEDVRLRRRLSLRDPALARRRTPGERPPGAKTPAEVLRELAIQTGMPLFAECEYRPREGGWRGAQWWMAADIIDQPLHEALDLICADFEMAWEFVDDTLLIRPRLWFLEPKDRRYRFPPGVALPGSQ